RRLETTGRLRSGTERHRTRRAPHRNERPSADPTSRFTSSGKSYQHFLENSRPNSAHFAPSLIRLCCECVEIATPQPRQANGAGAAYHQRDLIGRLRWMTHTTKVPIASRSSPGRRNGLNCWNTWPARRSVG